MSFLASSIDYDYSKLIDYDNPCLVIWYLNERRHRTWKLRAL